MIKQIGRRAALGAAVFAAGLVMWVAPVQASHDPELTGDELKCQFAAAKNASKFASSDVKCIGKCFKAQQKGDSARDCRPAIGPVGDGDDYDAETRACIDKGNAKCVDKIGKKCADPDPCPDCSSYAPDCATDSQAKCDSVEALVDLNGGLAFCDDSTSSDGLNDDEAKCQQATGKNLGKLPSALNKCTASCVKALDKGDSSRDCAPAAADGDDTDATTDACLDAAQAKCDDKIAGKCTDAPECQGTGLCGTVRGIVDTQYTEYYCDDTAS